MLFNSPEFLIFFPVVVGLFFALPHAWRHVHLLVASYVFYMWWEPAYALLVLLSTVVDFTVGKALMRSDEERRRKMLLGISLAVNLGLLGSFKYYNFINNSFEWLVSLAGLTLELPDSNMLLPVGISFYTFQTIGYTVDIYWRKVKAEQSFIKFALYVTFFPQLVAGPIERADRLLPQFHQVQSADATRILEGLRLMGWGLFKKVVVADRLAALVDPVYEDPARFSGLAIALGAVGFGYQVFCDFSGYSDIAIGAAKVMGFDLMRNFQQPHGARSVREFWRRWHISLLGWFRDYVYIPIGGSRGGALLRYRNILILFGISGLWHGADWSYVTWGLASGMLIIYEQVTADWRERATAATGITNYPRLYAGFQRVLTMTLVWLSFIFLRADGMVDSLICFRQLTTGWGDISLGMVSATFEAVGQDGWSMLYFLLLAVFTECMEYARLHHREWEKPAWPVQWVLDWGLVLAILALGKFSSAEFYYFQF